MSKYLDVLIVGTIGFLFHYFLISWLVEGSYWLHIFLALSLIAPVTSKMYEDIDGKIKQLQIQVQMMKDEIMSLTSIIENNESKIDNIEDVERRLSNLEYRFSDS